MAKLLMLTAGLSQWGSTVCLPAANANANIRFCSRLSSGGCTVSAHGFFLQSGLQPQMVLTTGQDAEVFHVVSPGGVLLNLKFFETVKYVRVFPCEIKGTQTKLLGLIMQTVSVFASRELTHSRLLMG